MSGKDYKIIGFEELEEDIKQRIERMDFGKDYSPCNVPTGDSLCEQIIKRAEEKKENGLISLCIRVEVQESLYYNIIIHLEKKFGEERKTINYISSMSISKEELGLKALNLTAFYLRWDDVAEHGSSSPIWTDGQELNYIRKRIITARKELQDCIIDEHYEALEWELPPSKSEGYMLYADKIRELAQASLKAYQENEDYQYIISHYNRIDEEQRIWLGIDAVLSQVAELMKLIKNNSLVKLKRHGDSRKCLASFHKCRIEMEELITELEDLRPLSEIIKEENMKYKQMDLFQLLSEQD